MNIEIKITYPCGTVAGISIPLSKQASATSYPNEGQTKVEVAFPVQESAPQSWSEASKLIHDFLDVETKVREKEEGEGKGRIGGMGERKERGVEEEKPEQNSELYNTQFETQNGHYLPPVKMVNDFIAAYGLDVVKREFRNAKAWLSANPKKRKTLQGMGRFLNAWISRAQRPVHVINYKEAMKRPETGSLLEGLNDSQEGW
jgi:hypothetical protein